LLPTYDHKQERKKRRTTGQKAGLGREDGGGARWNWLEKKTPGRFRAGVFKEKTKPFKRD
jgi:hypothetical protein